MYATVSRPSTAMSLAFHRSAKTQNRGIRSVSSKEILRCLRVHALFNHIGRCPFALAMVSTQINCMHTSRARKQFKYKNMNEIRSNRASLAPEIKCGVFAIQLLKRRRKGGVIWLESAVALIWCGVCGRRQKNLSHFVCRSNWMCTQITLQVSISPFRYENSLLILEMRENFPDQTNNYKYVYTLSLYRTWALLGIFSVFCCRWNTLETFGFGGKIKISEWKNVLLN